jgi:GAF domain-containing protein
MTGTWRGAGGEVTPGLAANLARVIAPGADLSVTLGPPTDPHSLDSTTQLAQHYDGLQMRAGEGPCQSAWESAAIVLTDDLSTDPRWPGFTDLAATAGLASVLAVPVRSDEKVLGVVNAYATEPAAFARLDVALAELTAYMVGQVLHRVETIRGLTELVANLRQALSSRSVIDQAKGILVARHGYDPETAFHVLSEQSQHRNVKLRVLASQLVAEAQRPS